jgi:hypothetical protein
VDNWLLEYDSEGEIYTVPSTDSSEIERVLNLFDGSTVFYCALYDCTNDTCLWCTGEPDRRIIEGRLFDARTLHHFVLRRTSCEDAREVTVRHGVEPDAVVTVPSTEVLTAAESVAVFLAFYQARVIPSDFESVAKARLFGSLSFGI